MLGATELFLLLQPASASPLLHVCMPWHLSSVYAEQSRCPSCLTLLPAAAPSRPCWRTSARWVLCAQGAKILETFSK